MQNGELIWKKRLHQSRRMTYKLVPGPNGKEIDRCQVDLQRKEECKRGGGEIQGKVSGKKL